MKTRHQAFVLTVLLFLGLAATYLLQLIGMPHPLLTSSLFLVPPALAVLSGLNTLRLFSLSSPNGQTMLYLTAGLAALLIGEALFFAFQFTFHTDPFPSAADYFYLLAYPLLFVGLIKAAKQQGFSWRGFNKFVLVLSSILIAVLAFIVGYFGIFLAYDASQPLLNNVIALGYGVGDLILLVPSLFILKLAFDFRGGKLFYSWMMILLAILCLMVGDILFAIFTDQYEALNPAYSLIDLAWIAAYLLFAYSFFYTSSVLKELQTKLLKNPAKK